MKKWITFDLDGTLMQNPFGKYVFPEIDALVGAIQPGSQTVEKMIQENKRRMESNDYPSAYDWDDMLAKVLLEDDITASIDIEKLVKNHSHHPKVYLLEDDIPDVLRELQKRGFSLAVVTNGFYKYQIPVMEALGIAGYFDEIITPDKTNCGKPDTKMCETLTARGKIVAHVGDRIDHDVVLANRIGALSVLIDRRGNDVAVAINELYRPDAVIKSISEILKLNI